MEVSVFTEGLQGQAEFCVPAGWLQGVAVEEIRGVS